MLIYLEEIDMNKADTIRRFYKDNFPHITPVFRKKHILLTEKMEFVCKKHKHKFLAKPSDTLRSATGGCFECKKERLSSIKMGVKLGLRKTTKEFRQELSDRFADSVKLISKKYQGGKTDHTFLCNSCGNEWKTKPINILNSKVGCPNCGRKQAADKQRKSLPRFKRDLKEATGGKVKLVGDTYYGDGWRHKFKCACGNKFTAVANTLLQTPRNGCGKCSLLDGNKKYSRKAVAWMNAIMEKKGWDIQHAENGGELKISLGKRFIFADGYCKETNTVFEFHGDIWHGNLMRFSNNEICSPFSEKTAKQLYDETQRRHLRLIRKGFNVVFVWESHYDSGKLVSGILYA